MERFALLIVVTLAVSLFCSPTYATTSENKPIHDPFKVLIQKPKPHRDKHFIVTPPPPSPRPQIPPLNLKVTAIAGEGDKYVAVIRHKGSDFIVEKNWEEENGLFKVKRVTADKVEVFYSKTKKQQVFFF